MARRLRFPWLLAATVVALAGCEAADGGADAVVPDTWTPDDVVGDPGGTTDPGEPVRDAVDPGPGDPGPADPGAPDANRDADVPASSPPAYLIVYQDDLADAAEDFAAYRSSTGYHVASVAVSTLVPGGLSNRSLVAPIRARIEALIDETPGSPTPFLLLLGDAPADGEDTAGRIPAVTCDNDTPGAGGCWTDNAYGDLDGDRVPEVAVGRVPARTVAIARAYLDKVKDHEANYAPGPWNRRISIYTGEANFGAQIDALLEYAMFEGLKAISHDFDIVGAYDNPKSAYYYTPFEDKVVDLFNQGNLMTVYVGHGSEEWTQGLTSDQIDRIDCQHRLPVVFFFACYAGNHAGDDDSLAETILWRDGGAIAAIGATDVSHPYGNAVLAYEVPRAALDERQPTAGEVLMRAKQQMVWNQDDEFRSMVSASAFIALEQMGDDTPLPTIEIQHNDLYNLLGDPAVAMKYPPLAARVDPPAKPLTPGSMTVTGTVPGLSSGRAWVTLEVERDTYVQPLTPIDPKRPDHDAIRANWAKANDKVIAGLTVPVVDGAFQADLLWDSQVIKAGDWIKVLADDGDVDQTRAPSVDAIGSAWTH